MNGTVALILLAAVAVAVSAPSPEVTGQSAGIPSEPSRVRRVRRQAPGADILSQVSEAFQQHVTEKMQRVADVLGSLGLNIQVPVPNVQVPQGIASMAQEVAAEEAAAEQEDG